MTLQKARVVRFSPKGLSDTLDITDEFPGAMASLQNLIPEPSTTNIWVCRPSSQLQTSFGSFSSPGYISVFRVIGTYVFGMIASNRFTGKDEPFAFNIATGTFTTIANVLTTNVPTSPSTTGDWTPPTMDVVGARLMVTHPGFSGSNYFGWIDIGDLGNLRWHAGNLWATGAVITLGAITPGAGGTNGTYTNLNLTGGSGSGLNVDVTVSGNVVTAVTINSAGSGYATTDTGLTNAFAGAPAGWSVAVATVQTTGAITLAVVPSWVRQFYQRAYFGINPTGSQYPVNPKTTQQPSVVFTDILGLGCTNATQALTFGNDLPLVAAAPLGLSNQLGGIIQSLMVFLDDENVVQITGDASSSNLSLNTLNVSVGTIAPRSICETPMGIAFLAADGFRIIDFDARISDPIGEGGKGVVVPFLNAVAPTRINAVCNGELFRVSVQPQGGNWVEYWYDLVRKCWSGPHTFPSVCIDAYGAQFILAPQSVTATLYLSNPAPRSSDNFVENGVALTWAFQTAVFADNQEMAMSEIAELQIKTTYEAATPNIVVQAIDENGNPLNSLTYTYGIGSLWNSMGWDIGTWDGVSAGLYPRQISFQSPTVYNRLALKVTGTASAGFKIGDVYLRARTLGYMQAIP